MTFPQEPRYVIGTETYELHWGVLVRTYDNGERREPFEFKRVFPKALADRQKERINEG